MKIQKLLLFLILSFSAYADQQTNKSDDLPQVSEKLGQKIDLNLAFTNERGETKTIKEMFGNQEVLIITLNYFRCTTMCTYQLLNLSENLKNLDLKIGEGFNVATISFDPTDTVEKAQTTQRTWAEKAGDVNTPWHFYVGPEKNSQKLASELNFYFEKEMYGAALSRYLDIINRYKEYSEFINLSKNRASICYNELAKLLDKDSKSDSFVFFRDETSESLKKKAKAILSVN